MEGGEKTESCARPDVKGDKHPEIPIAAATAPGKDEGYGDEMSHQLS